MRYFQNWAFQWYWQIFKRNKVKRTTMLDYAKNPTTAPDEVAKELLYKVQTAAKFGKVVAVFAGDSNVEFGDSASQMVKFGKVGIVVNIGKAGSRFDHWVQSLSSANGKLLVKYLVDNGIQMILNLGGNHVLQNSMENFEASAIAFKNILVGVKTIVAADLPDIMTSILAKEYNKPEEALRADLAKGNEILKKVFPLYMPLGEILMQVDKSWNNAGTIFEVATGVFGDGLVHYSPKFNKKVRYPYYSKFFLVANK